MRNYTPIHAKYLHTTPHGVGGLQHYRTCAHRVEAAEGQGRSRDTLSEPVLMPEQLMAGPHGFTAHGLHVPIPKPRSSEEYAARGYKY